MIGNLAMLTSSAILVGSIYFFKKENLFRDIFDDIRNSSSYHMDYVEDAVHLPTKKYVILFGPAHSFNKNPIISASFLKKQIEADRLWKFNLKEKFYLETASRQKITVQPYQNQNILAFNLPQTSRELKDQKYEQRAIIDKVPVCCYGKLIQKNSEYFMEPKMILGNKHESLLVYLDQHIIGLNRKGKLCTLIGLSLIASHALYRFGINRPKTDIQKQIESQKQ